MTEAITPTKPLISYSRIASTTIRALNLLAAPALQRLRLREVDYGTFMSMTENGEISEVQVESNRILFTDKDGKIIYKTGLMDDPNLTQRL